MTQDTASAPYRRKDFTAAIHAARNLQRLQTKRAIYATAAFLFSCACVVPFSKGFPLHSYAEPLGRLFVYSSMVSLVVCVIFVGIASNTWFNVRNMEKD
jgi:protein-S-isoprenylcysteine O-methyltransferase Ste14